jgi:hypothetical protein
VLASLESLAELFLEQMDEALHSAASHSASATAAAAEGQQGDASPPQPQPRASAQPPPPPIRLLLEPARATRANSSAGATALLFPRRAPLGTQRLGEAAPSEGECSSIGH